MSQKSVTYCADVAYDFDNFFQNQYFADCTVFIPGQEPIRASRTVISNYSTFFDSSFTTDMEESVKNEVQIKYNPCNMLPSLIHYMHTERIEVTPENIMPLIEISKYYGVDSLYEGLCSKLDEVITPKNVLYFVQVCYENELLKALEIIAKHVSKYYASIENREEFTNIFDITTFCTILTDAIQIYGFRGNIKQEILQFMGNEQPQTQEQADALNSLAQFGNGIPNNWRI